MEVIQREALWDDSIAFVWGREKVPIQEVVGLHENGPFLLGFMSFLFLYSAVYQKHTLFWLVSTEYLLQTLNKVH